VSHDVLRDGPSGGYRIPFNRSTLVGRELEYIAQAMRIGQIAGDQTFTRRCHDLLETTLGVPRALLTTSCTHALELAALLLETKPGDEVVVPSFTFVSTVNAFVLRGATPRIVDIRPDTFNLDETQLERVVGPRTRAIVPVHYAGVGCTMEPILEIARAFGAEVVEDNAHGLFGKYRGRWLGTFGGLATQSFHETKNVTCGEGGALIINDERYVERAEILREKGTDRSRFFRGEVDRYGWVDLGSSYLMSDVLAAFLFGQLIEWPAIQKRRAHLWERYDRELADWTERHEVRRPIVPEGCEQAYHMFYLLMPSETVRARLLAHLKSRGILAVFHYQPLHTSQMGRKLGGRPGDCPVAEDVSERLLRLPLYVGLDDREQDEVITALMEFREW
jgi:dTDP-4-amino-4,6-dideoxygalactose transaminase